MQKICYLITFTCAILFLNSAVLAESQQDEIKSIPSDNDKVVSTSSRQIMVRVQLAEVSVSNLRKLELDFSEFQENEVVKLSASDAFRLGNRHMYSSGQFSGLLDAMVQNGIARILADPCIATVDGRTASLSVGGTVNIADQERNIKKDQPTFIHVGTDLTVLPTFLTNDRVSIDLKLSWSELCGNDKPLGCKRKYEIDTSLETEVGSSFLLSSISLVKQADAADEKETAFLLLVTPELAEQTALVKHSRTK
ncbi:Bacterial type II and III secretion system protein [Bythopirellula polymerisocia]|uniref:Bacterial type II and III secretion system protein n=2 Tax=Bythopirellula polymerisocia TaxID=2528003 RepID=A0A5C6CHG0_9BACT|nr:Bacterial type II and III secretion system protein [Bythopirellula polymerisocia]